MTLKDYILRWQEVYDKNQSRPTTYAAHGYLFKNHILPRLGEIPLEEAVRIIKRDTRHFAKRQLTWFRRERDVIWIDRQEIGQEEEKIVDYMLNVLREKNIIP